MAAAETSAATPTAAALLPALPFPSTWKASLSHWWSANATASFTAQNALIRRGLEGTGIPLYDYDELPPTTEPASTSSSSSTLTPSTDKIARLRKIPISSSDIPSSSKVEQYLNVLEVGPAERQPDERAFLVLHGYGGAFAFYWQNFRAFTSFPNTRIYFMDMLGMGLSSRPKFPTIKVKGDPASAENVRERVAKAESFFLDSFDAFAKEEKLENFTMIGHSMGGYLSTAYAIKRPEKVNKLILVSPVGVPRSPYKTEEEERKHAGEERREGLDREFQEDQLDATQSSGQQKTTTEFKPKTSSEQDTPRLKAPSGWWTHLWEANISPFSIVRMSSFAGPKLVSRYAARRFATFESDVQADLFNYLYGVYGQKGSGEYCLAHLLSPGAYARWPLMDRFKELDGKIPVSFIYGENDWMDEKGGRKAAEYLKSRPEASQTAKTRTSVKVNPHAGHWVFLDNPAGFDKILIKEMHEALQDGSGK